MPAEWETLIEAERRWRGRILRWLLTLFGGVALALLAIVALQALVAGDTVRGQMIEASGRDLANLLVGLLGIGTAWLLVRAGQLEAGAHALFLTIIGAVVIDGVGNGARSDGLILVLFLPIAGANLLLQPGWSFRYALLSGGIYLVLAFAGPRPDDTEALDLLMRAVYVGSVFGGVAILTFQAARSQERQLAASLRDAAAIERARAELEERVAGRTADLVAALAEREDQAARLRRAEVALRQSEEHFRALIEHASDAVTVIAPDGTIRYESPANERILGYPAGEMVGANVLDFVHPDDFPAALDALIDGGERPGATLALKCRFRHRSGEWRMMEVTATNLLHAPSVAGIVLNARDVTTRERAERQRAAFFALGERLGTATTARAAARIIAEVADDLLPWDACYLVLYSAETDTLRAVLNMDIVDGRRREVPSIDDEGYTPGPLARRTFAEGGQLILRDTPETAHAGLLPFGDTARLSAALLFVPIRSATGIVGLLSIQSYTPGAYTADDLAVLQALADHCGGALERTRAEEALAHQAFHDALTGLPNRASLLRWGAETDGGREAPMVLFIDLDGFKHVNDSLGHEAGDQLLIQVAERLRASLRPQDRIARFGGDEFVILPDPATPPAVAEELAGRLLDVLRAPFAIGGHELVISASIGIAGGAGEVTGGAEELLRRADIALYRAKSDGKARYAHFDPQMDAEARERLAREHELRRALERGEFVVHYQPTVALATGRVEGVEALVRWQHPTLGLLPPGRFIPLAEETGLILPLGGLILRAACRQARDWLDSVPARAGGDAPLVVSVNLSAVQLRQPDLVAQIAQILAETDLPPGTLQLEITESVVMGDAAAAGETLRALKTLGVRLAIDDFGTGYSSLAYLRRFPVDVLKIDKMFVDGLGRDAENSAIVRAIASLAHALGLCVVAEGVETAQQADLLRALGCAFGQGFYFARAGTAEAIGPLLVAEGAATPAVISA